MPDNQPVQDFHAAFTGNLSSEAQSHPLFAQLQALATNPAMQNSDGLAQYQALQAQLMTAVPQAIQVDATRRAGNPDVIVTETANTPPKAAADQPPADPSASVAQASVSVTTPVAAAAVVDQPSTTVQVPASSDAATVVNVKCGDVNVLATGGDAVAAPVAAANGPETVVAPVAAVDGPPAPRPLLDRAPAPSASAVEMAANQQPATLARTA